MVPKCLSQETGWMMLSFTKIGKTEGWNIVRFFCGKGADGISVSKEALGLSLANRSSL